MSNMTSSRLRVASDVGGTFTDNLAYDEAPKRVTVAKVPTTPENRALGTVRGLRRALAAQGRGGGDVGYVGHGMTTATNARDPAQRRPHRLDHQRGVSRPAADRAAEPAEPLRHPQDAARAAGRARGLPYRARPARSRRARNRAARRGRGCAQIAERLRADGVAAVAICLLHAYANPAHERRAKAILTRGAARRPGLHLDRYPRRVPRIRAGQHGRAERLSCCRSSERYLASPDRTARRPRRGLGARGATCRSW